MIQSASHRESQFLKLAHFLHSILLATLYSPQSPHTVVQHKHRDRKQTHEKLSRPTNSIRYAVYSMRSHIVRLSCILCAISPLPALFCGFYFVCSIIIVVVGVIATACTLYFIFHIISIRYASILLHIYIWHGLRSIRSSLEHPRQKLAVLRLMEIIPNVYSSII